MPAKKQNSIESFYDKYLNGEVDCAESKRVLGAPPMDCAAPAPMGFAAPHPGIRYSLKSPSRAPAVLFREDTVEEDDDDMEPVELGFAPGDDISYHACADKFGHSKIKTVRSENPVKYNLRLNDKDSMVLDALLVLYADLSKTDLINLILRIYLKRTLHDCGDGKDVAMLLATVADAIAGQDSMLNTVTWRESLGGVLYSYDGNYNLLTHNCVDPSCYKDSLPCHHSKGFKAMCLKLREYIEDKNYSGSEALLKFLDSQLKKIAEAEQMTASSGNKTGDKA